MKGRQAPRGGFASMDLTENSGKETVYDADTEPATLNRRLLCHVFAPPLIKKIIIFLNWTRLRTLVSSRRMNESAIVRRLWSYKPLILLSCHTPLPDISKEKFVLIIPDRRTNGQMFDRKCFKGTQVFNRRPLIK